MKAGDVVKFTEPQDEYEREARFVVLEDRDTRMAVKDLSLMSTEHDGTLLRSAWTVYATADLEGVAL